MTAAVDALLEQLADAVARRVVELQRADAEKRRTRYLTPEQMAERLGVSTGHLANLRSAKNGPKFVRVGGRVRYVVQDDAA